MKHGSGLMAVLFMLLPLCNLYSQEKGAREDNTLRIMSYNIRNGRGMDDVSNFQRTADVINKVRPNVVAVQEVDSVTGRSGQTDVLRVLADKTLMYPEDTGNRPGILYMLLL